MQKCIRPVILKWLTAKCCKVNAIHELIPINLVSLLLMRKKLVFQKSGD